MGHSSNTDADSSTNATGQRRNVRSDFCPLGVTSHANSNRSHTKTFNRHTYNDPVTSADNSDNSADISGASQQHGAYHRVFRTSIVPVHWHAFRLFDRDGVG